MKDLEKMNVFGEEYVLSGGGFDVPAVIEDETIQIPLGGITDADKTQIVQDVLAGLGVVGGSVDADHDIILDQNVVPGRTYTMKYIDTAGNLTEIGSVTVPAQE